MTWTDGQSREARRAAYLKAAIECREKAAVAGDPEAQQELVGLAAQYEELAEFVMLDRPSTGDGFRSDRG